MAGQRKNVFWVGANIIFDTVTGEAKPVLLFVYRIEDASVFNRKDADNYYNFVTARATRIDSRIRWSLQSAAGGPDRFVIRGEQDV